MSAAPIPQDGIARYHAQYAKRMTTPPAETDLVRYVDHAAALAASEARVAEARETNRALHRRTQMAETAIPSYQRLIALPPNGDGIRLACRALLTWYCEELTARAEAAEQSLAGLRAFAQDVMETWPEGAPDGGELQEYATKHGLLREVLMPAPCGTECACLEYLWVDDFPTTCYRKTTLLTGRPESDESIAAIQEANHAG